MGERRLAGASEPEPARERLESWGEIAGYLGRTVRTVQRWEKQEGLPVHRHTHEKLASVWALRSELDTWSQTRQLGSTVPPPPRRLLPLIPTVSAVAALVVAAVLTALLLFRHPQPVPFERVLLSPVSSSGRVGRAAISPDGRFVAFADGDPGDQYLALKDLVTGTERKLAASSPMLTMGLSFSPGGSLLYVLKVQADDAAPSLHAMNLQDGRTTELASGLASSVLAARDGRLAFVRERDRRSILCVMAPKPDSPERELYRTELPLFLDYPAWCSDGRRLACTRVNPSTRTVEILAVDAVSGVAGLIGNRTWLLVAQLAWSPDGRYILLSARAGDQEPFKIWRLDVRDGSTQAVTTDPEDHHRGLSLSDDGRRLVTLQLKLVSSISLVDPAGKERELLSGANRNSYISWSPGNKLLFDKADGESRRIWVVSPSSGSERALTGQGYALRPSACGPAGAMAYVEFREGHEEIWRVDSDGGGARFLGPGSNSFPRCTPDGSLVLYSAVGPKIWPVVWKLPFDGGTPVAVTEEKTEFPAASPNGRQFAAFSTPRQATTQRPAQEIAVYALTGGSPLRRYRIPLTVFPDAGLRWSRDGRSLFYVDSRNGVGNVWERPLDGRDARQVTQFRGGRVLSFDWSPDGKTLAVSRGIETKNAVLIQDAVR